MGFKSGGLLIMLGVQRTITLIRWHLRTGLEIRDWGKHILLGGKFQAVGTVSIFCLVVCWDMVRPLTFTMRGSHHKDLRVSDMICI